MVHIFNIQMWVDCIRNQTQKKKKTLYMTDNEGFERVLPFLFYLSVSRYLIDSLTQVFLYVYNFVKGVLTTPSIAKGGVCKHANNNIKQPKNICGW